MYRYYHTSYAPFIWRAETATVWPSSVVMLNQTLRALWEQHVYWTRLAVDSIISGGPDVQATVARLLRNPTDFAQALQPYYGPGTAHRFETLLTEHLTIAAELVKALEAGDTQTASNAQSRWYANADEIADFLASINPYWSEERWRTMLHEHLDLLTSAVAARLGGKYEENIALADPIEQQALGMADEMTQGIANSFPHISPSRAQQDL